MPKSVKTKEELIRQFDKLASCKNKPSRSYARLMEETHSRKLESRGQKNKTKRKTSFTNSMASKLLLDDMLMENATVKVL